MHIPEGGRIGIAGGGILGLAVGKALQEVVPDCPISLFEKEDDLAMHQTGRNSGVVHAGVYYQPGSLKARLCVEGVRLLLGFCDEKKIPYEVCGKLVVAVDEAELPTLRSLHDRAVTNGVPGARMVDPDEMRDIEPHVRGVAALYSPQTAIVDFGDVARGLAEELIQGGSSIRCGVEVVGIQRNGAGTVVKTTEGDERVDLLINCAGLHADRLAQRTGGQSDPRIVPFRGEYYSIVPARRSLVRGLIYPVPDPRYPFLGIHLTKRMNGEVLIGPNALLALAREGYNRRHVNPKDVLDLVSYGGFRKFARQHWRVGVAELRRSFSKRRFIDDAARYVPDLKPEDVIRGPSGVRAQALDPDGSLVDDFRIEVKGAVVHVRNAPSPAATSSLAIGRHVVQSLDIVPRTPGTHSHLE